MNQLTIILLFVQNTLFNKTHLISYSRIYIFLAFFLSLTSMSVKQHWHNFGIFTIIYDPKLSLANKIINDSVWLQINFCGSFNVE